MSSVLSMLGHVDGNFVSVPATRTISNGYYAENGLWVDAGGPTGLYVVNIQPASDREIDFIRQGGERIVDVRRIYINNGDMQLIDQNGIWTFLGQKWKSVKVDNRYWRNYCKVLVNRIDDQTGGPA